ncbi:MAG: phosphotransferase, partial [Chloroflexota bacterium]
ISKVDDNELASKLLKTCYYHVVIVDSLDSPVLRTVRQYQWLRYMVAVVCAPDAVKTSDGEAPFAVINNVLHYDRNNYYPYKFWLQISKQLDFKGLMMNVDVEIENPEVLDLLSSRMIGNLIDHISSTKASSRLYDRDTWLLDFDMQDDEHYAIVQTRLAYEIGDVLRRSIKMRRLDKLALSKIGDGLSKAAVAMVTPHRDGYLEGNIIKLGYHKEIEVEYLAYEDYVRFYQSVKAHSPSAQDSAKTPLLSSINYQFVEGGRSFVDMYSSKFVPMDDIEEILEYLFGKVYEAWFADMSDMQISAAHYMDYLNCQPERFYTVVDYMQKQPALQGYRLWGVDKLILKDLPKEPELENPFTMLHDEAFLNTLKYPARATITHGDLNANNMLIKQNGEVHLIDFARTAKDHALRDFIQLETVVRFTLMKDASLRERFEMEQVLAQQSHFMEIDELREAYQPPDSIHADELRRAFLTTCKIRELAWKTVFNA